MKQEYEDLLLKDLCARLSYGVKVLADINKTFDGGIISEVVCINLRKERVELEDVITPFHYDEVKPYLRPISSMTEEEKKELGRISCEGNIEHRYGIFYRSQDYLNSIHVAYRTIDGKDMFELGLALEAPEGMYK